MANLLQRTLNLVRTSHFYFYSKQEKQINQIQSHLITSAVLQNPSLANSVIKFATLFNDFNFTFFVFKSIHNPNTFVINTVLKSHFNSNCSISSDKCNEGVVFYYEMMKNGFEPNSYTYPPIFSFCGKNNNLNLGIKIHGQVFKHGFDSVLNIGNSLMHFYSCCGVFECARKVFDEMNERDIVSFNTMIDGYVKIGELGLAHKVFDLVEEKNFVTYNVLISGYLKSGNPGLCLKLFREMGFRGLKGNEVTIVSVLSACGRSARLREGKSVHCFVVKALWDFNVIVDTALVDMYSRCYRVDVARLVFDRMAARSLVCCNAMILGHCLYGYAKDGLELYESMVGSGELLGEDLTKRKEGKKGFPDEITFVGVLCACARLEYLTEGSRYLKEMVDLYGLKPNFGHYWCMANLLSNVGLVQEAIGILKEFPRGKDDSSESLIWAGLLGSCRFEGSVVLGEQIAKYLIELEPENAMCYRLLLHVYAVAGRWGDVAEMKQMMKRTRLKNMTGLSLLDLKEIVHEFNMGDNSQRYLQEISVMAAELAQKLSLLSNVNSPSLSSNADSHKLALSKMVSEMVSGG